MKFDPKQHIIGKVYDLTQEDMQAMLMEIDRLRNAHKILVGVSAEYAKERDELRAKLAIAEEALEIAADRGPDFWLVAEKALSKIRGEKCRD